MKIAHCLITVALIAISASVLAAPIESVESARASVARQKIDAFLGEQMVVEQLTQLGVTPALAQARVAKLNDSQLEQLAAQIDLLHAGGTIQDGNPNPLGPLGCVIRCFRDTFRHLIQFLFCWDDV
jgi:hypothetical protein